jgi:ribosome-associated protein
LNAKALQQQVREAIEACREKKGEDVAVLRMEKGSGAFTDYFVICSGSNPRQIQAISDEVEERLSKRGLEPLHIEGYNQAEWVLLDYVDFVVHVFSDKARHFYDLERLWKSAKRLNPSDLKPLEKEAPTKVRAGANARRKKPAHARAKRRA